jgi:exosortase
LSSFAWPAMGTVVLLVLAHLPLLMLQARLTWEHAHYRFFPLVPFGAGWLAVRAGHRLGPLAPGPGRSVAWLLGGCWAFLAGACLTGSPWLGTVATLGTTVAVIYAIGGGALLRPLLPAWGLLLLAIPPLLGLDLQLIGILQTAVSRMSSSVLDLLGVFHLRQGNVIRLADRPLLIEEACSGIHSLFAVLAGMVFLAIWCRRSLARGLALMAAAVTWVMLGNILRIVAVVFLASRWQVDVTSGWSHEALGLAVFALALGLTVSTDNLFSFFVDLSTLPLGWSQYLIEEEGAPVTAPEPITRHLMCTATRLPDLRRTAFTAWPLAAAYGVLLLAQPMLIGKLMQDYLVPGSVLAARLLALRAGDLPASWDGAFQQQGLQTVEREVVHGSGRYSQVWSYGWGRRSVTVSADGPFQGWHELTSCYVGNCWTSLERSVQPGEGRDESFAVARLERPPALNGELFFSMFDDHGKVLEPGQFGGQTGYLIERLRFWRRHMSYRTYQVQVLVQGGSPLTTAERDQAMAFFQQVRSQLIQRLGPGSRKVSS